MNKLELGELYSREDVHKLFGGDSRFTPGAGTWGIIPKLLKVEKGHMIDM